MKRDLEKTRTALLLAAEKLMTECDDPNEVTARAITREAGVNLAMINYCFGSREELLFEVFSQLYKNAPVFAPVLGEIAQGPLSPKEKLAELHYHSMKLMLENFKYCKALKVPMLPYKEGSIEDGSYIDDYNALYDKL